MILWDKVAEIAGGGYGLTFLVLIILSVVVWIIGYVLQRWSRAKREENPNTK